MGDELPKGTAKIVFVVGGAFLLVLTIVLVVAASGPTGGGATIGPPDPPRSIAPAPSSAAAKGEEPCYLYMIEGNLLDLPVSLDRVPTFVSRAALLEYADARLAKSEARAVEAMKGLATLESRGARVEVVTFDLLSMKIIGSKGPAWVHPTWCQDAPPR